MDCRNAYKSENNWFYTLKGLQNEEKYDEHTKRVISKYKYNLKFSFLILNKFGLKSMCYYKVYLL